MALPPLPAIGDIRIWLVSDLGAKWDHANWDVDTWSFYGAIEITQYLMNMQLRWGADNPSGILSVTAAGQFNFTTYDPDRILDPSNPESLIGTAMSPGAIIHIEYQNGQLVRKGYVDTVSYDLETKQGTIAGSDNIPIMVGARLRENFITDHPATPNTLRERANYLIAQTHTPITVEDVQGAPIPIGLMDTREISLWSQIQTDAFDALHMVWTDRFGTLRFHPFDSGPYKGLIIGGVNGIPIETITIDASLENVYAQVVTYDMAGNEVSAVDPALQAKFGDRLLRRQHGVPNAQNWANAVLADRRASSLQFALGTLRPQTAEQLKQLIEAEMTDLIDFRAINIPPPIVARTAHVLGMRLEANTDTGWSAEILTYIRADEYAAEVASGSSG